MKDVSLHLGDCLDVMAGMDAESVACAKLGRPFIGIEQEQRSFEIAKARIEHAVAEKAPFF